MAASLSDGKVDVGSSFVTAASSLSPDAVQRLVRTVARQGALSFDATDAADSAGKSVSTDVTRVAKVVYSFLLPGMHDDWHVGVCAGRVLLT